MLKARGFAPEVACAFVLGTGLGGVVDDLEDVIAVPYGDIPGFPQGNVSGHARALVSGRLSGRPVLVFQGRAHYYETRDAAAMRIPLGLLTEFGNPPLVLTNAAGSTRADLAPGSLVLISDHISYNGPNPLIGMAGDERFVSMTGAYDPALRRKIAQAADKTGVALEEGVYMWFSGPSFETPAEVRMARILGADLVGMSTVPEVILARSFGLTVAGLSIVTNLGAGIDGASPSHGETRDVATAASVRLRQILKMLMTGL